MLVDTLRSKGVKLTIAQEPGGTRIGKAIRELLLHSDNTKLDARAELLLYFASRVQNLAEVIRPALEVGRVVVCDRFTDATEAYQGYGRGLGSELIRKLDRMACNNACPDLTLWLDLDSGTAVRRAQARNDFQAVDEGRFESQGLEFFSRVHEGYKAIHAREPERFVRIDASGAPDEVAARILPPVLEALKSRGALRA